MANTDFNFRSSTKDVQNRLISQSIRNTSNLELLRSEEAIQDVIKSYIDRFRSIDGMLFDVSRYLVVSKDIIRAEQFNEMFESLYIDLTALYSDLSLVEQVLELNLQRNKNYFLIIKKRIRDLWNKLNLARLYIYDSNPSDESFYESFYTDINSSRIQNVSIDKKNGFLYMTPRSRKVHNRSYLIKNITSTTYPVNSDNGGALRTTSELNTFEENYQNGPRDMMRNGLWKEEVICDEVPDIIYNIGSSGNLLMRNYKGVLSIIDIEYVYPVEMNRLDLDIFGDKPLLIDAILYKRTENDNWRVANFALEDPLEESDPTTVSKRYAARGSSFDVMSFYNISTIKAKYLRLVVNQENYDFIETKDTGESDLDLKIQNDLTERRYELVKFGSNYEKALSKPVNDENVSLYNKIVGIIESVSSVEAILQEIEKVLLPQVDVVTYDFSRTMKFEPGLWSIEPILDIYERQGGIFDSKPYEIKDRSLVSVSLKTGQKIPEATTCNWYINVNNKDIPVAENGSIYRKEPISPISLSNYNNFKEWSPGSFILLNFPVDPFSLHEIGIYTNGDYNVVTEPKIASLNSRLLFIKDLKDPYRSQFVIRYPCSMYDSVNLYVLASKPNTTKSSKIIPLGIVSSRREVLKSFIKSVRFRNALSDTFNNTSLLSESYSVVSVIATKEEAKQWFGEKFNSCLFIATEVDSYLNQDDMTKYNKVIKKSNSKIRSTKSDMLAYFAGNSLGPSDLNILSSISNLAPFSIVRIV